MKSRRHPVRRLATKLKDTQISPPTATQQKEEEEDPSKEILANTDPTGQNKTLLSSLIWNA